MPFYPISCKYSHIPGEEGHRGRESSRLGGSLCQADKRDSATSTSSYSIDNSRSIVHEIQFSYQYKSRVSEAVGKTVIWPSSNGWNQTTAASSSFSLMSSFTPHSLEVVRSDWNGRQSSKSSAQIEEIFTFTIESLLFGSLWLTIVL
ncbi:1819_t:CDS:2, partial [Acaulospora colombiana]